MKIKFEPNDDLPSDKMLNIPIYVIIVKSVFQENDKYYPQVHLHECCHEHEYDIKRVNTLLILMQIIHMVGQ